MMTAFGTEPRDGDAEAPAWGQTILLACDCAFAVVRLLWRRRLHLQRRRVGEDVALPDGRRFVVFRESNRDPDDTVSPPASPPVLLAVWFHLRGVPAGARVRRSLFERCSIVNTLLFAGFDGYLVKLWLVNPETSDYAGLYSFGSEVDARHYGRYITSVLRWVSTAHSVGFEVDPRTTLDAHLARQ
jgi:hypothetical protein